MVLVSFCRKMFGWIAGVPSFWLTLIQIDVYRELSSLTPLEFSRILYGLYENPKNKPLGHWPLMWWRKDSMRLFLWFKDIKITWFQGCSNLNHPMELHKTCRIRDSPKGIWINTSKSEDISSYPRMDLHPIDLGSFRLADIASTRMFSPPSTGQTGRIFVKKIGSLRISLWRIHPT